MPNYFAYFTEIEDRFQKRRGTVTLLSTLDWALIETWREAGVPLEAVLRGIDDAFDKYDARAAKGTRRLSKVNGLAWAAQSVMAATEQMKEAAVGTPSVKEQRESGFEPASIARYLQANAAALEASDIAPPAKAMVHQIAERLCEFSGEEHLPKNSADIEALERSLTIQEERLYAALMLIANEQELASWREQAARGLTANRGMSAVQIRQVTQQFLNKRILEKYNLPRLSLFYMEHR